MKTPIILAGDFNAKPCSPEIASLEQTFIRMAPQWFDTSHAAVWTHTDHQILIDHIFYNDPDEVLEPGHYAVLRQNKVRKLGESRQEEEIAVTDNFPVFATFKIRCDAK